MSSQKHGHYVPADFPLPVRGLAAISRLLAVLEGIGISVCLLSLIALATFQFVSRNLRMHNQMWMPASPDWIDSVLRHSVFLLGFLGAAYATFTSRHIRIDAVTRTLAVRPRMALRIVTTIAAIVVCIVLVKASIGFLAITREEAGDAAEMGALITSSRGAMMMIAGFAIIAFHFFVQLSIDATYVISGRQPPPEWIAEASHGAEGPPLTNQEVMAPDPDADEIGGAR
jgi:TRAP-type C4-dicarboxylate transport system permease small subunit